MDRTFSKVCVLVTAAFALTLVPGFRRRERSVLSMRDQGTALLVFLMLGAVEAAGARHTGWLNERIVAVCAAGLVAGPGVGLVVSVFVTWLAVGRNGLPVGTIGVSMLCAGLAWEWLYRRRPDRARRPLTGFCLTVAVSWLRNGLTFFFAPEARAALPPFGAVGLTPVLQGLGTALILAIVAQARATFGLGSGLLIGVDLKKDPTILHAAYNDGAGVTAAFILNLLHRLNRDIGADFDLSAFFHYPFYNPVLGRVEMHLVSRRPQTVDLGRRGHAHFGEGEGVHTESSYEYTLQGFRALAARASYRHIQIWTDPRHWFSLQYLSPVPQTTPRWHEPFQINKP